MATFPTDALSTRCANPEYQLDVDVMILEYLLYAAIKAYFKLFHSDSQNGSTSNTRDTDGNHHEGRDDGNGNGYGRVDHCAPEIAELEEEAERLLTAFDCKCDLLRFDNSKIARDESPRTQ